MKERTRKKYIKQAMSSLNNGKPSKFYLQKVIKIVQDYHDNKYMNEFRPWWYDNIDNWKSMDFVLEHEKFYKQCRAEIESMGVDMERVNNYFESLPKRVVRNRKPRKPKPQPIRKLKDPKPFRITMNNRDGLFYETVTGEVAFKHGDHEFFIFHRDGEWRLCDVMLGAVIAASDRYDEAVEVGKLRIEKNYDSYVQQVDKHFGVVN